LTAIKRCTRRLANVADVLSFLSFSALRQPSPCAPDADAMLGLLAAARRVRAELRVHPSYQPLREKNVAVLMSCRPGPESALLQAAAIQLGARVALVTYAHRADPPERAIDFLGDALGRMYDAIACECVPPTVPLQIARRAGVPVMVDLGSQAHQAAILADVMTLLEHPLAAHAPASVNLVGGAGSPRAEAFAASARSLGFAVRPADADGRFPSEATFEVDATKPEHWSLRARDGVLDQALRADNHLRLVQAVLVDEVTGLGGGWA